MEPETEVRPQTALSDPADGLDDAAMFGAFLDAVRWGAIASADPSAFQREMREKFGLAFEIVNTDYVRRLRRERGVGVNPFRSHPRLIVSLDWVKFDQQMRWFDEFLPADSNEYPRALDLLIVDEAHQIAPAAVGRYARDSLRCGHGARLVDAGREVPSGMTVHGSGSASNRALSALSVSAPSRRLICPFPGQGCVGRNSAKTVAWGRNIASPSLTLR